jgi:hypothetical protein
MKCESIAKSLSVEDGVVQIAFDLAGSPAVYLILSKPRDVGAKHEFFGEDHYAEVQDQIYGGYGVIEVLEIDDAFRFHIRLKAGVPGVGRYLTIISRTAMPDGVMNELRTLERR